MNNLLTRCDMVVGELAAIEQAVRDADFDWAEDGHDAWLASGGYMNEDEDEGDYAWLNIPDDFWFLSSWEAALEYQADCFNYDNAPVDGPKCACGCGKDQNLILGHSVEPIQVIVEGQELTFMVKKFTENWIFD